MMSLGTFITYIFYCKKYDINGLLNVYLYSSIMKIAEYYGYYQ